MINKRKEIAISNIDNKYQYLKQFVSEIDANCLKDNYKYFNLIEGVNYIAKNDKDICEIMDDLLLISKNIDDIHKSEGLNPIYMELKEIVLDKICTKLCIPKKYLIPYPDVTLLYPKEYNNIDGKKVTILYNFENYTAEYIIKTNEEDIETNTMIKLSSDNDDKNKEIVYINNELFDLFDEEAKKDIKNTLYKVYDGMSIYENYMNVFSELIFKINKEIENRYMYNGNIK